MLDRQQTLQVLLEGSLGSLRKKTERDKLVEQVSGMSVGDLFDTLLRNQ
ncbi:hypothetical protein ACFO3D_18090 [Virgibacillus kekensis]|uniref:Uncharacterized protein n=1 Tax=Virgibacillus kekensis TaxID=202261 RepID=A0ABV9DNT4_9BACI